MFGKPQVISKRYLTWLVALLILSALLCTAGLDYGRPRPEYSPSTVQKAWLNGETVFHPDAFAYVGVGYQMLLKHTLNPDYFHNPSLNIYTDLLVFALSGAATLPHNLDYGLREVAPFSLYVMGEYLSALFAVLTVAMAYTAGRVAFSRRVGLLTASLAALSPLTVQHAHYATPNAETLAVSTGALLVACILFKRRQPTWVLYVLAGLLVGLTGAARYNAIVVGVVTVMAMAGVWWRQRRLVPMALGLAAIPVGFVLGTPGAVFAFRQFSGDVAYIVQWYKTIGGGAGFTTPNGIFYHWRYTILFVVGPVAGLAAVLGLGVLLSQWRKPARRQEAWIGGMILLYLIVYTVLVLPGLRINANLLLPLTVPVGLLAAYGLVWLWTRLGQRTWLFGGLAVLLLAWPGYLSLRLAQIIATPDNRIVAEDWIYQHIPRRTDVYRLGSYNVPLDPLDYPGQQTYGGSARLDDPLWNSSIIAYSDAKPYTILRDPATTDNPADYADTVASATKLQTEWTELVRFPRMYWPGQDTAPDDVSLWHQVEIVVYCNPAKCPVTRP